MPVISPVSINTPITPTAPLAPLSAPSVASPAAAPARDFRSLLVDHLGEVNRLQQEADTKVTQLMTGQTDDVAEVLTAVNKAGLAFDLLMEVRNKLVAAYEEIQQMRV